MSLDDPKVDGITIYVSHMRRPITDRFHKDFFTDPSQVSRLGLHTRASRTMCVGKEKEKKKTRLADGKRACAG